MGGGDGSLTVAGVANGQPLDQWMKNLMAQQDDIVRMNGLPDDVKMRIQSPGRGRGRGFGN